MTSNGILSRAEVIATGAAFNIEMILQMAPEQRTVMNRLCQRIAVETNSAIFDKLVCQLNDLLGKTQQFLTSEHRNKREESHHFV